MGYEDAPWVFKGRCCLCILFFLYITTFKFVLPCKRDISYSVIRNMQGFVSVTPCKGRRGNPLGLGACLAVTFNFVTMGHSVLLTDAVEAQARKYIPGDFNLVSLFG